LGLGIGPQEGVILGANVGRRIVTNGEFTAYSCAEVREPSELWFGVVRGVCWDIGGDAACSQLFWAILLLFLLSILRYFREWLDIVLTRCYYIAETEGASFGGNRR